MTNILILFHSRSGNTETMAHSVAEGARSLPETTVRLVSIDKATAQDLKWCDGLALGSPTNFGTVSGAMKQWWDDLPPELWGTLDGRIGCAFSSAGAWGGGSELTCLTLMTILMNYGFPTFGVTDYVDKQFSPHYGATSASNPNESRVIKGCERLGRRLSEWSATMVNNRTDSHPLHQTYDRFQHLGE